MYSVLYYFLIKSNSVIFIRKKLLPLQSDKKSIFMKKKSFILLLIIACLFGCRKNSNIDYDDIIQGAYKAKTLRNLQSVNLDSLAIVNAVCVEKGDMNGSCICEGVMGFAKFYERDYLGALILLKDAESKLQFCDSMSGFVYHYLSEILATEDSVEALRYINKAIAVSIGQCDTMDLVHAYRQKANIVGVDSAKQYISMASDILIARKDTFQNLLCWSRYAINYYDKLHPDSVIKFVKPLCEIRPYALDQMVLADAYVRKGEVDSAIVYVNLFENHPMFQIDKYYLKGEIAELRKEVAYAATCYKLAYETYDREINEYLKLNLSDKNSQYNIQRLRIESQKEKMALYRAIIILLIALLLIVLILIVLYFVIKRYRDRIGVMNMKQDNNQRAYNSLLSQYVSKYSKNINRETIVFESNNVLAKVKDLYPALTKTDIAIIWLLYLKKDKRFITNIMSITDAYYFQRRTIIYRTFGFDSIKELDVKLIPFITSCLFE